METSSSRLDVSALEKKVEQISKTLKITSTMCSNGDDVHDANKVRSLYGTNK